ncbi:hypothetical protein [Paenibacillus sp. V4I5]|uniref:hypothetical protein n=1 Tax=Paenibacillus sp. V4I5 TaxID=3042306 RepID=UPI0027D7EDC2|nr:hypothetical protein [Paenibacillus sp. V4I5]
MGLFKGKNALVVIMLVLVLGVLAYIVLRGDKYAGPIAPETSVQPVSTITPVTIDGVKVPAKVGGSYIQINHNGEWQDMMIKGVNLGATKPGLFPGEMGIAKADYLRWFKQMGDMNVNSIRIYTLHPPAFYEALLEYNSKANQPIYLFHGIWVDEEDMVASKDVFIGNTADDFKKDMQNIVDVIHGQINLPERAGHAAGAYKADVSPYVVGWILGVEWDPTVVDSTNNKHKGMENYNGRFFRTENAQPFEIWLADKMESIAVYESDRYQWQRPISFTNWVTTDLMQHPTEPSETEDTAVINPNLIKENPSYKGGYFASYHVYPYYPDFLNYEPKYTNYIDFRGEKNNYSGYLNDLKQNHQIPVLIAEFGVPSSRGMAHRNVAGWNQGNLDETEQGNIDARLFEDINHEGLAGGLLFSWQNEWFKRTWNTQELDNSDRRPFWSNMQTGEQHFGLLSFEPGPVDKSIYVDGETSDWDSKKINPIQLNGSSASSTNNQVDGQASLKKFYVTSDEGYVYFRLDFNRTEQPLDWSQINTMLLLSTIPNQGQHRVPGDSDLTMEEGIDFVIDLKGDKTSRIWVDSYYDTNYFTYGHTLGMMPKLDYPKNKGNGIFHTMQLVLNKPLTIPNVNGKSIVLPLESYETGLLRSGDGNPNHPNFNSLTDVSLNAKDHVLELRIPWQLLNFRDPSKHETIGDIWGKGLGASEIIKEIKMAVVTYKQDRTQQKESLGSGASVYTYPQVSDSKISSSDMYRYQWADWDIPQYHERLKKSYYIMKDLFGRISINH